MLTEQAALRLRLRTNLSAFFQNVGIFRLFSSQKS